jgi:hypothetical protein
MGQIQYEVHFANGDVEFADSVEAARNIVLKRAGNDQAPADLLPADIWETGPNQVGVGRRVARITSVD